MNRNLDGCYFRVKRDDKWQSICFSDLTADEREEVCKDHSIVWWRSLAYHLADCLKGVGDHFDIVCGEEDA